MTCHSKVSIIFITLDRFEATKKTLDYILNNTEYPNFELLAVDNGSTDQRVIDYIKSLNPAHYLLNKENIGVANSLNRLIKLATGEFICHIGNDIIMESGWLRSLVDHQISIQSTGVCAIHTVEALPPLSVIAFRPVHMNKIVFGPKMYRKKLVDSLAYKEFSKYGLEDSDLSLRFYYCGYYNYYIPNYKGNHIGHGSEDEGEYREIKNKELALAGPKFIESINEYKKNDISRY